MLFVLIIDRFFQLGAAGLDFVVEIPHDSLNFVILWKRGIFTSLTHSSLKVSLLRSLSGFPAISCIPKKGLSLCMRSLETSKILRLRCNPVGDKLLRVVWESDVKVSSKTKLLYHFDILQDFAILCLNFILNKLLQYSFKVFLTATAVSRKKFDWTCRRGSSISTSMS